ncbi:NADP-specific glutamate dehydrogenase [Rodentibacter pneumotropicus]|uniref:NADP-specific glutamate dehydrogenase n=1 Tax=Rodentibacter pneumotropicus TaxID=758 RepID=A0A3S4Y4C2_9PAST|nr:NADP-specific glutamate dehydrogenase [Rodentibacter pneumotropicus]
MVTCSDSSGYVYDPEGFTSEKLTALLDIKNVKRGRVKDYAAQFGLQYIEGKRPWEVKADIALPCATQNELEIADAKALIANGVKLVAEGANMPTSIEATDAFLEAGVLFGPGKAANAGGVATSGLEMAQSSQRLYWTAEEVDAKLHRIMLDIHANCKKYGTLEGQETSIMWWGKCCRICESGRCHAGTRRLLISISKNIE